MKEIYTPIILVITLFLSAMALAQDGQKNFINYQGVARNADQQLLISETMIIGVSLKVGPADATIEYEESHDITTDANGVFSLKIGNGTVINGDFKSLPWGAGAALATITMNGNEVGTTEMMAVPYALSSADNKWHTIGDDIENKNGGNVFVTGSLYASKDLSLSEGAAINEFSTDVTLAGNSDEKVPTQKAIKTYIDDKLTGGAIDADADPTNEIQDISLSGTDLSITDGSTIDLSALIPPGGTDNQDASEVPFDNTGTGLAAGDTQAAIEELASGGLVDTDNQNLSLAGTILQITDGTGVDLSAIIPPGGTDDQNASEVSFDNTGTGLAAADTQAAIEELASGGLVDTDDQNLSLAGTMLQITDGTGVDLAPLISSGGDDNQRLDLNVATRILKIENGNAVDLSSLTDADSDPENEIDVTRKHGLLVGDDGIVDGLVGTVDGQVAKWDAALGNWVAGTDEVGGGGSSLWETNGSDIYFDSGKVGVGTENPDVDLHINSTSFNLLKLETSSDNNWVGYHTPAGYVGYSGVYYGNKDMDFGTGGGNYTGKVHLVTDANPKVTVIPNGNVGIGLEDPSEKLEVAGNIKTSGELHTSATGNANMVPIAYGSIYGNGTIAISSGNFTSSRTSAGFYRINITGENVGSNHVKIATKSNSQPGFISAGSQGGDFVVITHNISGVQTDTPFSFVIYTP